MLTVHHLDNSRSHRVLWLLEELELSYELKHYKRDPKTMLAPNSLKKIHPLGKSPILTDDSMVLAESAVILEYLVDRYGGGKLKPTGDDLRYKYWLHYAEGSAMPPLILSLVFNRLGKAPVPLLARPLLSGISQTVHTMYINAQLELHFDYMEAELGKSTWFCGDAFTVADIQMSFPIEVGTGRLDLITKRPKLRAFIDRIQSRPAYQRAIKKGGPFDIEA